jgi:hypothetical protein
MLHDIAGSPIPGNLLYAEAVNLACVELNFPPLFAYAVANRETIRGERNGKWIASDIVSFDGGHGLFQLTSWWPADWNNPHVNAHWAVARWLGPSLSHYALIHGYTGDRLMAAAGDAFNAGLGAVCRLCELGENPDGATTGHNYGADVVACYHALLADRTPT